MPEAARPSNETARLHELRAYEILDTPPEPSFDRLARLAAQVLDTPMALITLVDDERQWCKAAYGTARVDQPRAASFCAHPVADGQALVVPDATSDPRFSDNPQVLGEPGIRFYAGAPLVTPGGFVLGTLCGFDTAPRAGVTEQQRLALADLASMVMDELGVRRRDRQEQSVAQARDAQLRQSQKMEAVGSLAGGIAHDFNNLLTVINGYADIAMGSIGPDDPLRDDLEQIAEAGAKAAELTQQLLAFSRRQVLQPQLLDMPQTLRTLQPLLAGALRDDIALQIEASDGLPEANVDPTQLETVLENLTLNAADAMPSGGTITISCRETVIEADETSVSEVRPGRYLVIAVSDTGVGMNATLLTRVFEPFFTTKPKGHGTGLGLPTAYGIVTQSGGHLVADSTPGQGSTFSVYLPVAPVTTPSDAASSTEASSETLPSLTGDEAVLVVEDDEGVRRYATDLLTTHGYDVVSAESGPAALEAATANPGRFDLVLTDVVMPRMDGREVADALREAHGVNRALFMSGYTEDAVVRHGVLEHGLQFLPKPFTPAQLLEKVRETLNSPSATLTVVVADDEAPLRTLLARTLTDAGYEVLEARHGREAIALCRAHQVDLLLTDLVMPEQEGLETIREIRRELPHVHIVAMSGAFDGRFLHVARAFGAGAVMQKPFEADTVLRTVSSIIGQPAGRA